ncbi:hypothetical protein [Advenella sp. FME57]|uniref:hypothetical protein n=1 Tax=Advenella sp. FME57 TaxID=2742604 RepID=UPI001868C4DF|nr:hypothetical protein [Advenella sp. FME57]
MIQISFADAKSAGKRKQSKREHFLPEMDQAVLSWRVVGAAVRLRHQPIHKEEEQ